MISRLETLVLSGANLPVEVIRRQIASAIDIIVHLARLRDGSRKVMEISEIIGLQDGEVLLGPLFRFEESGTEEGQVAGRLAAQHMLRDRHKLAMAGLRLPEDKEVHVNGEAARGG
ncbi:secretion system protein E [Paenibacillus thiaminolyticus]|uniref:secretion system protein E n=1 Tax=Paenibacillus thiaminolyticus TaxID=49283 RepID=UPI001162CF45|nr:secretion system protein E [Paenibacillus thiaminolyticus]NGP58123.1 secretion system protein E [Paenibacillus thiaminolyticus]